MIAVAARNESILTNSTMDLPRWSSSSSTEEVVICGVPLDAGRTFGDATAGFWNKASSGVTILYGLASHLSRGLLLN